MYVLIVSDNVFNFLIDQDNLEQIDISEDPDFVNLKLRIHSTGRMNIKIIFMRLKDYIINTLWDFKLLFDKICD